MSIGKGFKFKCPIHTPFAPRGYSPQGPSGLTGTGCLVSDGVNYIQSINNSDPLVQQNIFTGFSLAVWVKMSPSGRLILAQGTGSNEYWDVSLYTGGSFSGRYDGFSFGGTVTGFTADTWHHLVFRYFWFNSNAWVDVYLNGSLALQDAGSFSSSSSANSKFTIYSYNFSGGAAGAYISSSGVKIARMTYWNNSNNVTSSNVNTLYNGGGLYDFSLGSIPTPTWNYDFGNNYYFDGSNYRMYPDNNSNPSFYQGGSGGGSDHDFNVIPALWDNTDHPNLI